ncbi:glycosyltransferase family A protein [Hahella ganghwensis]|uniref:glycosyltransferase family A protein n=1 Tax=Hahella ganghwensis TaxID=286420 RepID=UPI00037A4F2B|nr:glycosyltransferase family A protein [Hahella ganghwensis]
MKLGIVIPLKAKSISRNWQITCQALHRTIQSIIQQSVDNYDVVIVGHDCPDFLKDHTIPRIKFISVSTPVPDRSAPGFTHQDLILDKNIKIVTGIAALKSGNIDFWYQLDSDDLLHRDFVKTIGTLDGYAGAIIDGGYIVYDSCNRAIETKSMSQYCGSTSILADRYLTVPINITKETIGQIPWARYPHMAMQRFFKEEIKEPYLQVNDNMISYMLASGDNISDRWRDSPIKALKAYLKPYIKGRRLNNSLREQFGMV